MNENINLCELLRGHEGEIFYSPAFGNIKYLHIDNDENSLVFEEYPNDIYLTKDGKYDDEGECIIFPSKDQRDWNKWIEKQKSKVPKVFDEISLRERDYFTIPGNIPFEPNKTQKSAFALLKIHQLIEIGYGGNPSAEYKLNPDNIVYVPDYRPNEKKWVICAAYNCIDQIAFYTDKQCEEFLSYSENIELLKDFYMI